MDFSALEKRILNCDACDLSYTVNKRVIGAGTPNARVMLLGEAPGAAEDASGEPFVGKAGKRLDALLHLAELSRKDVYIANVVKCRPPKNRDPKKSEVAACAPFLSAQIKAVAPDVIVSMGNFATRFLLGDAVSISAVHGTFVEIDKQLVFPVYHPAAAIYDPHKQEDLENDFRHLGAVLKGRLHV